MIQPSLAMDRIERKMQRMQVDFQRFLNGAIELPPQDLEQSIRGDLRMLRNLGSLSSSESYRLSSIEARFTSFSQLNQKRLRQLEIEVPTRRSKVEADAPPPSRRRRSGVVIGSEKGDHNALERLYGELYPGESGAEKGVSIDRFSQFVEGHVARIREKTGCSDVSVQILTEDGRRRLKVRPVESVSADEVGDSPTD